MSKTAWLVLAVFGALALAGGSAVIGLSRVDRLADAIAYAEGFYSENTRPRRNNNPGDLTLTFGFPISGNDGMFPIFETVQDGWAALKKQISIIFDGTSHFSPDMTLLEMGRLYTSPAESYTWAANVAGRLGVSMETRLMEL